MFLMSDKRAERSKKILDLAESDICIAVIIAAADFEWTCRRCILALGSSPTSHIRQSVFKGCHGLEKYKDAWKLEVKPRLHIDLSALIPDWEFFSTHAFKLRHKLVHGIQATTGKDYGAACLSSIIKASEKLTTFTENEQKEPIYDRRIIRRKSR